MTDRYGQTRVSKIRTAYNDLRRAIRAGDIEAAEAALDRYEPWADFIFDKRYRKFGCWEVAGWGGNDIREPN